MAVHESFEWATMDDHFSLINDKQEAATRWGFGAGTYNTGLIPWTPRYFQKSLGKSLGVFSPVGNRFHWKYLVKQHHQKQHLNGWMEICEPQFGLKQIRSKTARFGDLNFAQLLLYCTRSQNTHGPNNSTYVYI